MYTNRDVPIFGLGLGSRAQVNTVTMCIVVQ